MKLLFKDRDVVISKESERTGLNYSFLRYFEKEALVDGKTLFAGIFTKALVKKKCIEVLPDELNIGFEYDEETKKVKGCVFEYSSDNGCYKLIDDSDVYNITIDTVNDMVNFSYNIMYRKSELEEINKKYFNNNKENLGGINMRKIYYDESIFNRPKKSLEELNEQAKLEGYPFFLVIPDYTEKILVEIENRNDLEAAYIYNTTNRKINSDGDLLLAAYIPFNLSNLGQLEIHWQLFGSLESYDTYDITFLYPYENEFKKLFNKIYSYPGDLEILSKMMYTRDMRLISNNEDIFIGREVQDVVLRYYLLRMYPKSIIVDGKVLFAGVYSKGIDMIDSPFECIPDSLVVGFEYDEKENIVRIHDFYYDTREECFKIMKSYTRENKIAYATSEITHVFLNVMYSATEYIELDKKYFGNNKFVKEQREKQNLGVKEMEIYNENRSINVNHTFIKEDNPAYINNERIVATIVKYNPQVALQLMEYTTPKGEVKVFDTSTDTMNKYSPSGYLIRFVNLKANVEDIIEVEREIKVPKDFDTSVLKSGFYAWDPGEYNNRLATVNKDLLIIGAYKHVPKDLDKINLTFIKRNNRLESPNKGDLLIGLDKYKLNKIKFVDSAGYLVEETDLDKKSLRDLLERTGIKVDEDTIKSIYENAITLKENDGHYKTINNLKRYFDNLD